VTTGITSDTEIIIKSGVVAGTQVVTQTIAGTATKTPAASTSLFGGTSSGTTRALGR
jgi:hypothetical protein